MEPTEGLSALRAWQTDIALIDDITVPRDLSEMNVETIELIEDSLYAILPASHPLSKRSSIKLRELKDEPWVLDTASHVYSEVIVRECRAQGFDPMINAYCNGIDVMIALIEVASSISVLPGFRLRRYSGEFVVKKISPDLRRTILVAFRRGERRNPAIGAFTGQLLDSAARLRETGEGRSTPLRS
jgi:DNA-binding transcriptional LysR family regulator